MDDPIEPVEALDEQRPGKPIDSLEAVYVSEADELEVDIISDLDKGMAAEAVRSMLISSDIDFGNIVDALSDDEFEPILSDSDIENRQFDSPDFDRASGAEDAKGASDLFGD